MAGFDDAGLPAEEEAGGVWSADVEDALRDDESADGRELEATLDTKEDEAVDVCDCFVLLRNVFCVPQLLAESGYEVLAMLDGAVPAVEVVEALKEESLADSGGDGVIAPIC